MREVRITYKILNGKHEERRPLGRRIVDVDGRIILNCILGK
jgi:hypothetical protein